MVLPLGALAALLKVKIDKTGISLSTAIDGVGASINLSGVRFHVGERQYKVDKEALVKLKGLGAKALKIKGRTKAKPRCANATRVRVSVGRRKKCKQGLIKVKAKPRAGWWKR